MPLTDRRLGPPAPSRIPTAISPRDRVIPDWAYRTDPSGQIRPNTAATYQRNSKPQILQTPTIAEDAIIPIVYGTPERIAGMPYTACLASNGTDLLVSFILCEGEVQAITNIEVGDLAPPAGVTFTAYKGTPGQGIDPDLAASIAGYDESHPGTAYLVGRFAGGATQGFPRVTAEVSGLRIPDPRAGGALDAWTNPALIIGHFMTTYARRLVNAASLVAAADYCDVLIGAARRATLTITLAQARDADEWIEVLRGYLPAWIVFKDGEWHIVIDQASAPVLAYDADADNVTDGESSMALFKRGARDVPNVIEFVYTDTTTKPWSDGKAVAQLPGLGTGQRRKASVTMPGIRTYAQAYRFAVERLNHFTLESIEGEIAIMDAGVRVLPGDIVTITDSAHGWNVKPVRVLRVDETDNGRWTLRFREYADAAYSSDAPVVPTPPSSGTLPNPITVAAIVGLTANESLKFEKEGVQGDNLGRGLIWQSRVVASWSPSADPFFDFYEVSLQGSAESQPSVSTSKLAQFNSAPLIQATTYEIRVRVVNTLGFASAWTTTNVLVKGKTTLPSDVTVMEFAAEIGGEVILRWRNVPDVDVIRYEWRSLSTAALTAAWDSMALAARVDGNYTRLKGFAPGQLLLAVKAIDALGQYSLNPFFVSVAITSDASNFLQSFAFAPVSGTFTTQTYPLAENGSRPLPRYLLGTPTLTWNAAMPNPVASVAAIPVVAGYGRNGNWAVPCNLVDLGLVLEATVKLDLTYFSALRSVGPGVNVYLAASLDGTAFDYSVFYIQPQGAPSLGTVSAKVTARYLRLEFYSASVNDVGLLEGAIAASVSSSTRRESGSGTSSASLATRVNLAQKYSKAVSITITPRGTTFASGSFNNVTVGLAVSPNYFDVYLFNATGAQIAQAFSWSFDGV